MNASTINPNKFRNIMSYIMSLNYTKNDLQEMYSLYIKSEQSCNLVDNSVKNEFPSKAFIGYEDIKHGYISGQSENVFDYIFRHSFKRPYDIMHICGQLSTINNCGPIKIETLRHEVNIASRKLFVNYLNELSEFLKYSASELLNFIKLIPGNILEIEIIHSICFLYHCDNPNKHICTINCTICNSMHIFSIMYSLGLLGVVRKHEADEYAKIVFGNVTDNFSDLNNHRLPVAEYYVLHPAVSYYIQIQRENDGLAFFQNPYIVIGDSYIFDIFKYGNEINTYINKCKNILSREKVFVSSTINDLPKQRRAVRSVIKNKHLYPIMSEYPDFDIRNTQIVHSHDHCLNELKKCKNCIFIIGNAYGGIYSGDTYSNYVEEIIELSNKKLQKVSISLMEYYLARKNNIKIYVFIEKAIMDNKELIVDSNLKYEIDFITHFKEDGIIKGNWISSYTDLSDLKHRISMCEF